MPAPRVLVVDDHAILDPETVEAGAHGATISAEHADFDIIAGLDVGREFERPGHMIEVVAGRAVEAEAHVAHHAGDDLDRRNGKRGAEKNGEDDVHAGTGEDEAALREQAAQFKIADRVRFLGFVSDPWGNEKAAFEADITINRKDFNLNWNATLETGGFLVGDDVKISLSIQALAQ